MSSPILFVKSNVLTRSDILHTHACTKRTPHLHVVLQVLHIKHTVLSLVIKTVFFSVNNACLIYVRVAKIVVWIVWRNVRFSERWLLCSAMRRRTVWKKISGIAMDICACVIPGFRRSVNQFFALLRCYAAFIASYWRFGTIYRSHLQGPSLEGGEVVPKRH